MKKIKDTHEGSFFGLDKLQHLIMYGFIAFVLCRWFNYWAVCIVAFALGLAVELLETSNLWTWIMHKMGENESKSPISYKDLMVNFLGICMAVVIHWSLR